VPFVSKIQVKNARGTIREISPAAFQKQFGVTFTSKLLIDRSCPPQYSLNEPNLIRKVPSPIKRSFFQEQLVHVIDRELEDGGAMKRWLYSSLIHAEYIANIYISKVNDEVGFGVFAGEELQPGQFLGEYTGLARKWCSADFVNRYVFCYIENSVIDASKRGNICRFINHSESKANARHMEIQSGGVKHIILLANTHIARDEQILFDYGPDYWETRGNPTTDCAT
jgi:SET domain-containing protein